jgi:hypothetical protein
MEHSCCYLVEHFVADRVENRCLIVQTLQMYFDCVDRAIRDARSCTFLSQGQTCSRSVVRRLTPKFATAFFEESTNNHGGISKVPKAFIFGRCS